MLHLQFYCPQSNTSQTKPAHVHPAAAAVDILAASDAMPHFQGATLEHYAPKHNLFNTKWHRFCHQGISAGLQTRSVVILH